MSASLMDAEAKAFAEREAMRLGALGLLLIEHDLAVHLLAIGYQAGREARREFRAQLTELAAIARASGA